MPRVATARAGRRGERRERSEGWSNAKAPNKSKKSVQAKWRWSDKGKCGAWRISASLFVWIEQRLKRVAGTSGEGWVKNQKMGQAGRGAGQRGGEDRRPSRRLALVFGEFGPVIMGVCWLLLGAVSWGLAGLGRAQVRVHLRRRGKR